MNAIQCGSEPAREGGLKFGGHFGAGRQPLHIPTALHRAAANPVGTLHGVGKAVVFQQGADHADGKTIAGTDGVDHRFHRHARDETLVQMGAVIRTVRAQFDRHGFGALVEVKRRDVGRVFETGQQAAFAQPRQHPMGEGGEAVDLANHLLLAGPQARAQVRVEGHAAPGIAHAGHQFERHFPRRFGQRRRNAGGVQVPGVE